MTDDPALLVARDVSITHDGAPAASPRAVSLSVAPGEVVLLLGPSGSGKSTFTLATNGLIPRSVLADVAGTLTVGGADAATATVAELSTRVGMVFQDPDAQLVTGTLLDEVAFGPENLRMPVAEVLGRAEAALTEVGLWSRRRENPDRLSGGGRQRLAIACALAMGSPLLVLDEPTANLDPRGVEDVYRALRAVVAAGDRGILLVEHDLDEAVELVDRVVVLDATGAAVLDGTVDEIVRGEAERLLELGVWLPVTTLAALRLRRAGFRLDPLPLRGDELRAALQDEPPPAGLVRPHPPTPRVPGERLIDVAGLTVRRGGRNVLDDVGFTVTRGEIAAVVGANGAGKTTLLQAVGGVRRPPRGSVRIAGRDVSRLPERALADTVGFVFQNPEHQFIAHTVFDELAHGLRLRHVPDAQVRRRTTELLERFGLDGAAHRHPFTLSGGQKRRLSVATALVTGAEILLLDEPTFGQDRERAEELLALLHELNDSGTTIVLVTHDMQLVADHADRVIVLTDGRIDGDGGVREVLADDALLDRAGLRPPPLRRALRGVTAHPVIADAVRLTDLPVAGGGA
ncbi:ABC transporter ATP-binding protein [Microbacterium aureliae]